MFEKKTFKELFEHYRVVVMHSNGFREELVNKENFKKALIEFARYHVSVALREALNETKVIMNNGLDENGLPSPHFRIIIEGILNAYAVTEHTAFKFE